MTQTATNTPEMFCFQCEQTLNGKACTKAGVCGKSAQCANKQDSLIKALIFLANVCAEKEAVSPKSAALMREGLFATLTNVNFDEKTLQELIDQVLACAEGIDAKAKLICPLDDTPLALWGADEDIRSLKSLIIFGLKGMEFTCVAEGVIKIEIVDAKLVEIGRAHV